MQKNKRGKLMDRYPGLRQTIKQAVRSLSIDEKV